jgi:Cutinase
MAGFGIIPLRRLLVAAGAVLVLLTTFASGPASAATPGPQLLEPAAGATLSNAAPMVFRVRPVDASQGYLWGFFRDGKPLWENYANERTLSGPEYRIEPGSAAANAIGSGPVRIWVRALIDNQWTDATLVDVQVATATGGQTPCHTVYFLGLRGSGEANYNDPSVPVETKMGALAGDTYAQFVQRANYVGVKVVPDAIVDYPAVPFLDVIHEDLATEAARHLLLNKAFAGVEVGVDALQTVVERARAAEPAACFILSGYSQGAWVIGEYLARPAGRDLVGSGRIAGVVLYADPLFNPGYPESQGPKYPGIARALGVSLTGKSPYVPEGLRGKILSICLEGDVVCNFRWRSLLDVPADIANASCLAPGSVICPHYDYRYSTAHLPTSDEGTAFLARVVLKL